MLFLEGTVADSMQWDPSKARGFPEAAACYSEVGNVQGDALSKQGRCAFQPNQMAYVKALRQRELDFRM